MAVAKDTKSSFLEGCRAVARDADPNLPNGCLTVLHSLYASSKAPDGTALFDSNCLDALRPIVSIKFIKYRRIIFATIQSIANAASVAVPADYFPYVSADIARPSRNPTRASLKPSARRFPAQFRG